MRGMRRRVKTPPPPRPKRERQPVFFVDPETGDVIDVDLATAVYKPSLRGAASAVKCIKVKRPLSTFDKRSIRTVVRGVARVLVGCPKGSWQPRKQRCKVGLKAYETITPGRCKRGSGGKTQRS